MSDSTVPIAQPEEGGKASPEADRVGEVAEGLIRDFHPVTALDVSHGEGLLAAALRDRGVDASRIDSSEQIEGHYDLLICIEVLERLSPADADKAIAHLCAAGETVVVSTTPGALGDPAGLNVRPPEDWAAKFAEHGFMRSLDRDLSYISPWAAAFTRGDEDRIETVRRYDRAWWQLRSEVAEVRRSLQDQRERLTKLEGEMEAGGHAELTEKLEQSETEILRLRDLLVGKEAELGVAVGRMAELELRIDWRIVLKHRWHQLRGALAQVPGLKRLKRLIRPR